MEKSRKTLCISLVALIMTLIGAGFLCDKFVQALSLRTELDRALKKMNYKTAVSIYKTMDKNVFFHNSINIKNTENRIIKSNLDALKRDFYNGNIAYSDAEENMSYMNKFDFVDKEYVKKIKKNIDNLNDDKRIISLSERLFKNGQYVDALDNLAKFNNSSKKVENDKKDLERRIKSNLTKYTEQKIDESFVKMDSKNALNILAMNSKYLDKEYVSSKRNEINQFNDTVAEEKIKITGVSSITNYLIIVDLEHQLTEIFSKQNNEWELKKLFQSSTGISGYDTPKGTFSIKDKGTWFFSEKYNEGAKYWVRFNNSYLFHSLPMNRKQQITDYTLGQAASHGCVRLQVSEAKWIFDNIPRYTKVIVK